MYALTEAFQYWNRKVPLIVASSLLADGFCDCCLQNDGSYKLALTENFSTFHVNEMLYKWAAIFCCQGQ